MERTGCRLWKRRRPKRNRNRNVTLPRLLIGGGKRGVVDLQKIECGPGQPPGPHRTWVPELLCHRWSGGMIALARQSPCPRGACAHFCQGRLHLRSRDRHMQPPRSASSPVPLREQDGRRPQRPGTQFRAMRVFLEVPGNSPSRITGLLLAQPQSFKQLRNSARFR